MLLRRSYISYQYTLQRSWLSIPGENSRHLCLVVAPKLSSQTWYGRALDGMTLYSSLCVPVPTVGEPPWEWMEGKSSTSIPAAAWGAGARSHGVWNTRRRRRVQGPLLYTFMQDKGTLIQPKTRKVLGWPKSSFFFPPCKLALAVFNFIGNNFVRLYCDRCHISVH